MTNDTEYINTTITALICHDGGINIAVNCGLIDEMIRFLHNSTWDTTHSGHQQYPTNIYKQIWNIQRKYQNSMYGINEQDKTSTVYFMLECPA